MMPPSPEQNPYPPPQYQPPYNPAPMQAGPKSFLNKGTIMLLTLIGIVMFFVGLMILSSTGFIKPPTNSSDYQGYQDTMRNMGASGRLIIEVGGLMSCIGLVCGGIAAEDVSDKIRAVMVSAGIAVVISTLVVLGLLGGIATL
jgi:hypothetical protein